MQFVLLNNLNLNIQFDKDPQPKSLFNCTVFNLQAVFVISKQTEISDIFRKWTFNEDTTVMSTNASTEKLENMDMFATQSDLDGQIVGEGSRINQ